MSSPSPTKAISSPKMAMNEIDVEADSESSVPDPDRDLEVPTTAGTAAGPTFPPLKQTVTSQSAQEAAKTLSNFAKSPENPHNWPNSKRWRIALTVAVTGFISTSGSSIAVPGFHEVLQEFNVSNEKVGVLITSIYVLGMGTGPFIFAPMSELYGRQPAYLISQVLMVLFCLGTALAPNIQSLIILRFFAGMWSSVGPGLGVATCADMFKPNERGRPISIYAIGPMTGPVLGSMLGYWILFGGWRWLFYALTIMAALNFILLVTQTRETYAPVLEKRLRYRITHPISDATSWRDKLSISRNLHLLGWMSAMVSVDEAKQVFGRAFSRPPRLLFINPVCFLFSLYYSYIYGIIYLCLVTIPLMFGAPPFDRPELFSYAWPQSVLSLAYVGLGVGSLAAATIAALYQDRIYKRLSRRKGDQGQPEYRLVLTQIGMIICPIGIFILGWTAQAQTHWIGPQIGTAVLLLGLTLAFNSIQNFIVDAFSPYSAAGTAAATALRSVIACILPIFAPDMFTTLGWGWGASLLAFVSLIAIPAPVIMFIWGKRLRERFKFEG